MAFLKDAYDIGKDLTSYIVDTKNAYDKKYDLDSYIKGLEEKATDIAKKYQELASEYEELEKKYNELTQENDFSLCEKHLLILYMMVNNDNCIYKEQIDELANENNDIDLKIAFKELVDHEYIECALIHVVYGQPNRSLPYYICDEREIEVLKKVKLIKEKKNK